MGRSPCLPRLSDVNGLDEPLNRGRVNPATAAIVSLPSPMRRGSAPPLSSSRRERCGQIADLSRGTRVRRSPVRTLPALGFPSAAGRGRNDRSGSGGRAESRSGTARDHVAPSRVGGGEPQRKGHGGAITTPCRMTERNLCVRITTPASVKGPAALVFRCKSPARGIRCALVPLFGSQVWTTFSRQPTSAGSGRACINRR